MSAPFTTPTIPFHLHDDFLKFILSCLPRSPIPDASAKKNPAKTSASGLHILEIGCGTGELALHLAISLQAKATVVAIDASSEAIAEAENQKNKQHLSTLLPLTTTGALADPPGDSAMTAKHTGKSLDVSFVVADVLQFEPTSDNLFDAVICARSLHHIFPLDKALQRIHKWLKPSGRLIVDEFFRDHVTEPAMQFMFDRMDLLLAAKVIHHGTSHGHGHEHQGHHGHHGQKHEHEMNTSLSLPLTPSGLMTADKSRLSASGQVDPGAASARTSTTDSSKHDSTATGPLIAKASATPSDNDRTSSVSSSSSAAPNPESLALGNHDVKSRFAHFLKHDPPLPLSADIVSALTTEFGKENVRAITGLPTLFHLMSHRCQESPVGLDSLHTVYTQEKRDIALGRIPGVGVMFDIVCRK